MISLRNKAMELWQGSASLFFGLLISGGLFGFVVLFPLDLDGNATCLYDSFVANSQPKPINFAQSIHGAVPDKGVNMLSPEELTMRINYIQLHNYINTYLLWWWVSTGLLLIGSIKLYKRRVHLKQSVACLQNPKMGNHI